MSHLTVPGKELRVALEALAPMAATGFDVKMLAAVHLRANSEKVTLSATDRYGIGQWTLTPTEQGGDVNVAIATDDITDWSTSSLTFVESYHDGKARYSGDVAIERTGQFGYTVRVLPRHELLEFQASMGLVANA